jgi:hypothetical protein
MYLRAMESLAQMRKGKRLATDRQIALFRSLPDGAKARLESGQYPPYHYVKAASRAVGVPVQTSKIWLNNFLYWRRGSLGDCP